MRGFIVLLVLVLILPVLPLTGLVIVDLTAEAPPKGVELKIPFQRILFEPLAGAAQFFFSLKHSIKHIVALFGLTSVMAAGIGFICRRQLLNALKVMLLAWLGFITLLVSLTGLPLPTIQLSAPSHWVRMDCHSHTWYSHDGLVSPRSNMNYHKRLGFDCFYITEHDLTVDYPELSPKEKQHIAFPGIEIRCQDGFGLIILGDHPFPGSEYYGKNAKDVIDMAHREGFLVICPHSLKQTRLEESSLKQSRWKQYNLLDVDGYEIFDTADKGYSVTDRMELISHCENDNLLMVGASDYHGWCSLGNVWTLIRNPNAIEVTSESLLNLLRSNKSTRILISQWTHEWFSAESIFMPLEWIVRYFCSLNGMQTVSWAMYLILFFNIYKRFGWRFIQIWTSSLVCLFLCLYCGYMIYCQVWFHPDSITLPQHCIPTVSGLAFSWLIISIRVRSLGKQRDRVLEKIRTRNLNIENGREPGATIWATGIQKRFPKSQTLETEISATTLEI